MPIGGGTSIQSITPVPLVLPNTILARSSKKLNDPSSSRGPTLIETEPGTRPEPSSRPLTAPDMLAQSEYLHDAPLRAFVLLEI
jgi:hypothetical protein